MSFAFQYRGKPGMQTHRGHVITHTADVIEATHGSAQRPDLEQQRRQVEITPPPSHPPQPCPALTPASKATKGTEEQVETQWDDKTAMS